jgi:hypothetical protein
VRLGLADVLSAGCSGCVSSHVSSRWPLPEPLAPVRIVHLFALVRSEAGLIVRRKTVCYLWLFQV